MSISNNAIVIIIIIIAITNIVNGTNNFNDTSSGVTRWPCSSMGGCSVDV